MKAKSILFYLVILGCLQISSFVYAAEPGEGISFDQLTGNYTVSYFVELDDGSKLLQKIRFEPVTKIEPSVQSRFHLDRASVVTYRYNITNSNRSIQTLGTVRFDLLTKILGSQNLPTNNTQVIETQIAAIFEANRLALTTPVGWDGSIYPNKTGGIRVSWDSVDNRGIQSGSYQTGFGFSSQEIPGLGTVELEGNRKRGGTTYPGEGPQGDIGQQFKILRQNDFVSRNAAVPTIAVPTPFNASVLLGRIQSHVHTWIASGLLDASFSSQLDHYFQAAIDAYSHNQPKVGKEHIETLRKMLKREHEGIDQDEDEKAEKKNERKTARVTIDQLAARILDFDLKYVLKRSGGEKE